MTGTHQRTTLTACLALLGSARVRGGVLELRDRDTAMVEITTPNLDAAARIIFVPLAKLRRVA